MSPSDAIAHALQDPKVKRRGRIVLLIVFATLAIAFIWERLHAGDAAASIEATTNEWQHTNRSMP
jgi:hypothetical protein